MCGWFEGEEKESTSGKRRDKVKYYSEGHFGRLEF